MKLLIVKTSAMGDIIHTFSAFNFIKAMIPDAQIDWVVEKPFLGLVEAHPGVHRAIAMDSKQWRKSPFNKQTTGNICAFRRELQQEVYDVIFDFQGNCKSAIVTWLANSPVKVGFGKARVPEWPNLLATNRRYVPPIGGNIRSDYLYLVQCYFQDFKPKLCFNHSPKSDCDAGVVLNLTTSERVQLQTIVDNLSKHCPTVMVCPGSNWKNKQVSEQALLEFLEKFIEHRPSRLVFIWGSESERLFVDALAAQLEHAIVLEKMSLPLLQNVMGKVHLVIAMDSLALHLAATTTTPTFSVFGPSLSSKYRPMGIQHISFQGLCPYGQTFVARCPKLRSCPTGACIRALRGEQLFEVFDENGLA